MLRKSIKLTLAVGLLFGAVELSEGRSLLRGGGGNPPLQVGSINWGTPFRYLTNYPAKYTQGDTWYSTWGDDNKTYVLCNDCTLPNTNSTFQHIMLTTLTPAATDQAVPANDTFTLVPPNGLAVPWGNMSSPAATGNFRYKSAGLICLPGSPHGILYANLRMLQNASWYFNYGKTIKSTDYGQTWTPVPPGDNQFYASWMFPGAIMASGFVQYGKCYAGAGPHKSDQYVYVGIVDGGTPCCPTGSWREWMARVPLAVFDNLNIADWQVYQGGDGMDDARWGPLSTIGTTAQVTLNARGCCGEGYQYLPRYNQYIHFTVSTNSGTVRDLSYAPGAMKGSGPAPLTGNAYTMTAYVSDYPWGPWHSVGQQTGTPCDEAWNEIVQASMTNGGQTFTTTTSGDPNTNGDPSSSSNCYTPFFRTVTLSP